MPWYVIRHIVHPDIQIGARRLQQQCSGMHLRNPFLLEFVRKGTVGRGKFQDAILSHCFQISQEEWVIAFASIWNTGLNVTIYCIL